MRYILPIHQNTEAWNGLAQEDWPDAQHRGVEIRALMHSGGEED